MVLIDGNLVAFIGLRQEEYRQVRGVIDTHVAVINVAPRRI